nr:putative reverse transcriptase domain-containing protein [Tanacetum cinerariifolium]
MVHEETVLSMQDVDVQSERIEDVVKEVAEEMVEVMDIAKIIIDEVSTAGGELNAANKKPVSDAPINITTAQPSEATKTTVDITTAPKAKGIVFANMKRVGTWFSKTVTPLFGTMMVQSLEEVGDLPTDVQDTPILDVPSSSPRENASQEGRKGRKLRLELEGHTFIIDLIPFGYGSFGVIVGMDWLSKMRANIVCFEKIVQIPLSNENILEVHGERPEGNLKQLKTMKVNEPKLKDIPVVHEFPCVFPEDLSGLPLSREVKFRIDLISGAMPVAKSPCRLVPTEMQELSNHLKEI